MEKCGDDRFEYYNICDKNCPQYTFKLLTDRYICSNKVPENFYLDLNDNVYKECYQTCKKCQRKGNKENNYCDEYINIYFFLNESSINKKNCCQKCDFYYYIKEGNKLECTLNNICPENNNKLILERNKCIDNCKKDDYFIYEFNNTCLENGPDVTTYNNLK